MTRICIASLIVAVSAGVATPSSTYANGPSADEGYNETLERGERGGRRFADRIAGVYMQPGTFPAQYVIFPNGTIVWWGSWFFGFGTENFFNGPVYGTWERTGRREIRTTEMGFLHDATGALTSIGVVFQTIKFSKKLDSFEYTGFESLYGPEQDVTDPEVEPSQGGFSFSGGPVKRLGIRASPAP